MVSRYTQNTQSDTSNIEENTDVLLMKIVQMVNSQFSGKLNSPTDEDKSEVNDWIESKVPELVKELRFSLPNKDITEIIAETSRRIFGFGFLDTLLPPIRNDISEILIYSRTGEISLMYKESVRWSQSGKFVNPGESLRVINKLLDSDRKQPLKAITPIVKGKLPATKDNPGGGRINAIYNTIAGGEGYSLNIRLYEQKAVKPQWLVDKGMISNEMLDFMQSIMEREARILIFGGTRTGKTTFFSAILNFLPKPHHIVLIEDPSEIWIDRPTVQQLEVIPKIPGMDVQEVTTADLVDTALRMSPDFLGVGEVRDGVAASALMRAMMTGHAGACTFHADSPEQGFQRLKTVMQADKGIDEKSAANMIAQSVDYVVQINIVSDHLQGFLQDGKRVEKRIVTSISKMEKSLLGNEVVHKPIFEYAYSGSVSAPKWIKTKPKVLTVTKNEMEENS